MNIRSVKSSNISKSECSISYLLSNVLNLPLYQHKYSLSKLKIQMDPCILRHSDVKAVVVVCAAWRGSLYWLHWLCRAGAGAGLLGRGTAPPRHSAPAAAQVCRHIDSSPGTWSRAELHFAKFHTALAGAFSFCWLLIWTLSTKIIFASQFDILKAPSVMIFKD